MNADGKFNKLGMVNRGLESTPDYGCADGIGYTEVEFNTPRYVFAGRKDEHVKEVTIYFYPDENVDFDEYMDAVKTKLKELGWI